MYVCMHEYVCVYICIDITCNCIGGTHILLCGIVQYSNLIGTAIGYTITASISMV